MLSVRLRGRAANGCINFTAKSVFSQPLRLRIANTKPSRSRRNTQKSSDLILNVGRRPELKSGETRDLRCDANVIVIHSDNLTKCVFEY